MGSEQIYEIIIGSILIPSLVWLCTVIWKKVIRGFMWAKMLKPVIKMVTGHEYLVDTIKQIKGELTTNGGSSIKDAINRIEKRQIMIDKRTKAIFYNENEIIFEVNEAGHILWANKRFHDIMGSKNITGLDWISFIDEPQRDIFLREIESCSEKLRELRFETMSYKGSKIRFSGFPYRDTNKNFGFLIYLYEL